MGRRTGRSLNPRIDLLHFLPLLPTSKKNKRISTLQPSSFFPHIQAFNRVSSFFFLICSCNVSTCVCECVYGSVCVLKFQTWCTHRAVVLFFPCMCVRVNASVFVAQGGWHVTGTGTGTGHRYRCRLLAMERRGSAMAGWHWRGRGRWISTFCFFVLLFSVPFFPFFSLEIFNSILHITSHHHFPLFPRPSSSPSSSPLLLFSFNLFKSRDGDWDREERVQRTEKKKKRKWKRKRLSRSSCT